MTFPKVLYFRDRGVDYGICFYRLVAKRKPKKGEWYLSGAIVDVYLAPTDLTTEYHVVEPTHKAQRVTEWKRGEAITKGV
jgi:hypothetical protein